MSLLQNNAASSEDKDCQVKHRGQIRLRIPTPLNTYSSVNCLWVSDDRTWPTRQSFSEGLSSFQKLHLYFPDDYVFYQKQQLRNGQAQHQKSCPAAMTGFTCGWIWERAGEQGSCWVGILKNHIKFMWPQMGKKKSAIIRWQVAFFFRKLNRLFTNLVCAFFLCTIWGKCINKCVVLRTKVKHTNLCKYYSDRYVSTYVSIKIYMFFNRCLWIPHTPFFPMQTLL